MGSGGSNNQTLPASSPSNTDAPVVGEGQSPQVAAPWVNFLDPGMGMSTGITPGMEHQMQAMYGPAYNGFGSGGGPPPGGSSPAAAAAMTIPKLQAPPEGSMRGWFQQAAQGVADSANKAGTLDAYLAGRDELAKLQSLGRFTRGQGSGGYIGSSHGGGIV